MTVSRYQATILGLAFNWFYSRKLQETLLNCLGRMLYSDNAGTVRSCSDLGIGFILRSEGR